MRSMSATASPTSCSSWWVGRGSVRGQDDIGVGLERCRLRQGLPPALHDCLMNLFLLPTLLPPAAPEQVRDLLPKHPHLRVILMSATLHIDLFSSQSSSPQLPLCRCLASCLARGASRCTRPAVCLPWGACLALLKPPPLHTRHTHSPGYFGGCPVVRVPGFTHPVEDFYLENVLQLTGYQEVAVQQLGGLTGGTGPGGSGGGSGKGAAGKLPAAERREIEAAIEAAFTQGSGGWW